MGLAEKKHFLNFGSLIAPPVILLALLPWAPAWSRDDVLLSPSPIIIAQAKDDKNAAGGESFAVQVEELRKDMEDFKKEVEEKSGISIGGFFDMNVTDYDNDPNAFYIGSFEFNMDKSAGEYFQMAAALVFSEDENGTAAELAVGFIDFHFYGGTSPRAEGFSRRGASIYRRDASTFLYVDYQLASDASGANLIIRLRLVLIRAPACCQDQAEDQ